MPDLQPPRKGRASSWAASSNRPADPVPSLITAAAAIRRAANAIHDRALDVDLDEVIRLAAQIDELTARIEALTRLPEREVRRRSDG